MKTEVLLRSIGKINDELIADAESEANTKRKPGWAKLGIMAACLALVLCTGIATHAIRNNATAGTFTMDVNPSVEYTIAKSGSVKNVRCLNSDAENALSDVALGKQSVETALTRTVAAYEACGYMENGEATVLISFDSRLDANAELKASLCGDPADPGADRCRRHTGFPLRTDGKRRSGEDRRGIPCLPWPRRLDPYHSKQNRSAHGRGRPHVVGRAS